MAEVRAPASAAALGHAGPVRAAAREASFADAAEGAARVHAALALAQQPALVQLSALVDVHAARPRRVELEAARTLAHGAARPGHAAAAHAAALVRILLRAVLLSRGLPQQQGARVPEGIAFTLRRRALGPGAARRAGAALGSPTAALATAAVVEGEGWPGQGARTHAIFSTLGPAHVPPLRGTLGWALRELAIAAGGPGHPGRAALAAVGARQVDAATRAAGCRVLALVYVHLLRAQTLALRRAVLGRGRAGAAVAAARVLTHSVPAVGLVQALVHVHALQ